MFIAISIGKFINYIHLNIIIAHRQMPMRYFYVTLYFVPVNIRCRSDDAHPFLEGAPHHIILESLCICRFCPRWK